MQLRTRFRLVAMILATMLAAMLVVWYRPGAAPAAAERLTLGVPNLPHAMPLILAEELGLFRGAGLDVTTRIYIDGKTALEALFAGAVDVAAAAETPLVLSSFTRRDYVIIGTLAHTYGDNTVCARADRGIRTAADLRGHRIGIIAGTTSQYFLHALLADQGLTTADVTEVALPAPEIAGHLASGDLDAAVAFDPFAYQALASLDEGKRTSFSDDRVRTSFSLATSRELPRRRADALARLLRVIDTAIAWAQTHEAEATAIMARRLGMDPVATAASLASFDYELTLEQTLLVSLDEQARWAVKAGMTSAAAVPNYLDFVDLSALAGVKPQAVTVIR
jgi:NitT/TauT family transport system substrate-binding protein